MTNYADDASLSAACAEGSQEAWLVFESRYGGVIYAIARWQQWRFNEEDAEDLCEDIFMKLLESGLRNYDSVASLKTYVAAIARNACLDKVRERKRRAAKTTSLDDEIAEGRTLKDVLDSGIDVAGQVMRNETAAEINMAYNRLHEECRTVLRLRYREEMSYDQIAKYTNVPMGTVCSLVSRCTERLMALVRPLMDLPGRGASEKRTL